MILQGPRFWGRKMSLLLVFQAICLSIFAAAGLAWVLNLFRKIELDADQKKILNTAFGVSVVGGLAATVGPGILDSDRADEQAGIGQPNPAAIAQPIKSPAALPTTVPSNPAIPSPGEPTSALTDAAPTLKSEAACKAFDHPPSLAQWANDALGTPPTFRCATLAPYPPCLEELRSRSLPEISGESARSCGDSLLAFRRTHISPVYAAKFAYQDNLDAAEASLRMPRDAEEESRRDHVVAEIARMNGLAWRDFTVIDKRSRTDMLACQSKAQRCLQEP